MTLLAADIAGGSDTGMTPRLRVFDAWASHSWASGTAPFADGNNQESTAEAVTAWAGLDLWARAAGDAALERQAVWLMSSEAAAAQAYWLGFDTDASTVHGLRARRGRASAGVASATTPPGSPPRRARCSASSCCR